MKEFVQKLRKNLVAALGEAFDTEDSNDLTYAMAAFDRAALETLLDDGQPEQPKPVRRKRGPNKKQRTDTGDPTNHDI